MRAGGAAGDGAEADLDATPAGSAGFMDEGRELLFHPRMGVKASEVGDPPPSSAMLPSSSHQ